MAEGSGGVSASSSTPPSSLLATPRRTQSVRRAKPAAARLSAQPASPSRNLAMLIQV